MAFDIGLRDNGAGSFDISLSAGATTVYVHAQAQAFIGYPVGFDSFTRTISPGFGTADQGGTWTDNGTGVSTNGSVGQLASNAGNTRRGYLAQVRRKDTRTRVIFSTDKLASGADAEIYLTAREITSENDYYAMYVSLNTNQSMTITLQKKIAGATTGLGVETTIGGLTHGIGTQYHAILDVFGSGTATVRGKVWQVGTNEPSSWTISETDSSPELDIAGGGGLRFYNPAGSTAGIITASFDNFSVNALPTETTVFAQSQAQIQAAVATRNAHAQSNAQIKQVYQGYAQSNAWIYRTEQGYAQSQTAISDIYLVNSTSFGNTGSQTGITVSIPTPTVGNLLVAAVASDKNAGTYIIPTGFIEMPVEYASADVSIALAYKIADGTETSVAWTQSNSSANGISAWVGEYSGNVGLFDGLYILAPNTGSSVTSLALNGTTDTTTPITALIAIVGVDTWASVDAGQSWTDGFNPAAFIGSGSGPPALAVAWRRAWSVYTPQTTFATTDTGDQMAGAIVGFKKGIYAYAFAQSQVSIQGAVVTTEAFAQSQADILQTYQGFAQSQADILQTYQGFAQSQSQILQAYQGYAQSQVQIKQVYQGYAQSQVTILTNYQAYAQSQADILQTYQGYAQSQGTIKQTYQGYAQSNALITATSQVFGQSQASVLQTYQGYAQSSVSILASYQGYAQANAAIKATYTAFAQSQVAIIQSYLVYAQSQAQITASYQVFAQSQSKINAFDVQAYAQSETWIKSVYQGYAQSNAYIKIEGINSFAQSLATIKQFYQGYSQSQTQVQAVYMAHAQSQAQILGAYNVHAQSQAAIKSQYQVFAQSQAQIKQAYQSYAQSNAAISQSYQVHAQSQAYVLGIEQRYAQSQAHIKTIATAFGQSQVQIVAIYQAFGQSQASIASRSTVFAQSNAYILVVGQAFAQSQVHILTTYQGYAQSQAQILATNNAFAQSQATVKQEYAQFAQSQSSIKQEYFGYAQSTAYIKIVGNGFAQSETWIKTTTTQVAQSLAWILSGIYVHAQSMARILEPQAYAQSMCFVYHEHKIKNVTVYDRHSIIVVINDRNTQIILQDRIEPVLVSHEFKITVNINDRKTLNLSINDRAY